MGKFFDRLCNRTTLELASRHVIKKGARGGLDGIEPHDLESHIDKTISKLIVDLRSGKYVPVPYAKGAIPKFNEKNEWRKLSLPSVTDKIVQQGFVDVAGPVFESEFLDCSYAYRKGKSAIKAIKKVEYTVQSAPVEWVVTMDIDNFFDTMDHDLLIDKISHKVDEPEMLNLINLWLNAGIISPKGDWEVPDRGIAQGSVVSPLFSNIFLHSLDKFAIDSSYYYIRYSDNFILFSENRETIYDCYERVKIFLESSLRLRLNEDPYPFKPIDKGFAFLGIYFKDDLRMISSGKETKIHLKLNRLTDMFRREDPEKFLERLNDCLDGIARHYSFINPVEQFETINLHLVKRLKSQIDRYREKGYLSSGDQIQTFLRKVHFLSERDDNNLTRLRKGLVDEVCRTGSGRKNETKAKTEGVERASQAKRVTAQKRRYLRKVADQAEVILSTPGIFVGKTGGRIIVREHRRNVLEIPFSKIKNIAINSNGITLSSDVILQCSQKKIPISFYTYKGMPYAVLQSPLHSMGTVSVLQIKAYETEKAIEFTKKVLTGKSRNQMNVVKFYLRSRKHSHPEFSLKAAKCIQKMSIILRDLQQIEPDSMFSVTRDRIFSAEGRISAFYWDCVKRLVPSALAFESRQRFNASDTVNCMLNYGYGILYQRVWQAVLKAGLNPHISFLHAFQANKPTLVYDLVEEYRQPFVDRPIFSLMTRGKRGGDLKIEQKTGMLVKDRRDQVIRAVLNRLSDPISFRNRKIKCEEIIEIQTRNLVTYLEGKEVYKPFIAGY